MCQLEKYLEIIDDVLEKGPYKPTWESLSAYEPPKWYRNAKFGIFIHWGIYSVPAFSSEWYSRNMYICIFHHSYKMLQNFHRIVRPQVLRILTIYSYFIPYF